MFSDPEISNILKEPHIDQNQKTTLMITLKSI